MKRLCPIYIVSKGRADSRLTSKALERMQVDYRIVIEPQEYNKYAAVIDKAKILVLPFSNLGQGSIPARNWIWEHSVAAGDKRHWIMDDNISAFRMQTVQGRIRFSDGSIFKLCEDFVERYENVALAGPRYRFHHMYGNSVHLNTRIYSCILILNKIPFRWRGRYNEDTDLSLRVLKADWCTVLFSAFMCDKQGTMTMRGGNTDELYKKDIKFDGRLEMARSLRAQHPDVVKITRKWNRWQHHVDYRPFKNNKLRIKSGLNLSKMNRSDSLQFVSV